jgi:malonyl-CoA O-methyltransferase
MNKQLVKTRFEKCLDTYELQADVQHQSAQILAEKAAAYLYEECSSLFEIGCGTGFLTRELLSKISIKNLFLNDIVDLSSRLCHITGEIDQKTVVSYIKGDAEKINFPVEVQAVLSGSVLQWMVDLPQFFKKVENALQSNGLFLFNTFGPDNFIEIKNLLGIGLAYPHKTALNEMLYSSFEIMEMWEETHIRYFDSPRDVLRHFQKTGVTASVGSFCWTKDSLANFENLYVQHYSCNDKIKLTWHVYYYVCKKII